MHTYVPSIRRGDHPVNVFCSCLVSCHPDGETHNNCVLICTNSWTEHSCIMAHAPAGILHIICTCCYLVAICKMYSSSKPKSYQNLIFEDKNKKGYLKLQILSPRLLLSPFIMPRRQQCLLLLLVSVSVGLSLLQPLVHEGVL